MPGDACRVVKTWVPALCVAGLCVAWSAAATAQADKFRCASVAPSTARAPAYAAVPGAQRCEGFFEKNVSQPFLEVLSLTRAVPGTWAADAEGRLQLSASGASDARLLIQPLRSNPPYRVDAQLAAGASLAWNSNAMLQATGLRLRDLGFLALVERGGDLLALAPLSMQGDPPALDGAVAFAVLRPSVDVSALAWRAYAAAGPTGAAAPEWQNLAGTPLFAWERIALPIPWRNGDAELRVDVRALDSQGQALPLLQFAVVGAARGRP